MDADDSPFCKICNEHSQDSNHYSSVNHRFQYVKWQYNEHRRALLKNRHGITLTVDRETVNRFYIHFTYSEKRGKYATQVTPEQLHLQNNRLVYKCSVKNTTQKDIYISSINFLHASRYFCIDHSHNFSEDNAFLKLQPGRSYKWKVQFFTDILTSASYKIPLSCNLQTGPTKTEKPDCFTIVRTFLIVVDDCTDEKQKKTKSPFTSNAWKEVIKTVPPTNEPNFAEHFPVPKKFLRLLRHGLQRYDGMNGAEEQTLLELSQATKLLTKNNYAHFWDIVLWLEETSQSLMLMKYNMQEVTMQLKNDDVLVLEVPGLAEKRPSVVLGDYIRIRISGDHTAYKGIVTRVNDTSVEISYVDEELLDCIGNDPGTELDVSFMLGRLSFERMHRAVHAVMENGFVSNLFPVRSYPDRNNIVHNLRDCDFFNKNVVHNQEQKTAVVKILNNVQSLPYIVFGPPGTGKSVTIIEAILQIKKHTKKRILVCAPANSACDLLASKLIPHVKKSELIRIHASTRDSKTIADDLVEYSNLYDGEFMKVDIDALLSYRIVVTTLVLVGRFAGCYRPDCVFVDEAAQASEPETDIALALLERPHQVILAGDPKQLGPMASDCAQKLGLGVSLLERLMTYDVYKPNSTTKNYNPNFITMLKLNFRSHPDILSIPNRLFYENNLKAMSLDAQRDPIVDVAIFPVVQKNSVNTAGAAIEFCSVSSKERREGSSPSFFNLFEAKMVVKYVQALIGLNLDPTYKVRPDQIGVVTPYKRQVFKIQEGLKFNGIEGVEVGTTESFQGREKRIILISTVRAQYALLKHDRKYNLGFVKHDQRFNVGLTRAISKLVVIGCPLVLRTDHKWEEYMNKCRDCAAFFGHHFEANDAAFKLAVIARTRQFKPKDDQYK